MLLLAMVMVIEGVVVEMNVEGLNNIGVHYIFEHSHTPFLWSFWPSMSTGGGLAPEAASFLIDSVQSHNKLSPLPLTQGCQHVQVPVKVLTPAARFSQEMVQNNTPHVLKNTFVQNWPAFTTKQW